MHNGTLFIGWVCALRSRPPSLNLESRTIRCAVIPLLLHTYSQLSSLQWLTFVQLLKVAIASRRKNVIDEAVLKLRARGIDAMGVQANVRDMAACEAAVAAVVGKWGRLDYLINNAAGNFMVSAENLTPNGFDTVLAIDLKVRRPSTHLDLTLASILHVHDSYSHSLSPPKSKRSAPVRAEVCVGMTAGQYSTVQL
jgi:NAD(P)-dependent dehydrogenase (short-subunit alcohol dehydrogenase family)